MGKRFSIGISSVITVLEFASMAFLIICCVTAPVFSQIGLSKYDSTVYGTFGYCKSGDCSAASANYGPESIDSDADWSMNSSARTSLGKILIVVPIAAGLTFFAMFINFLAQFSSVGRHAAVFVINLLLTLLAFASSALVCIVVFLLFYPHVTWCSWLLVPAAALNLLCVPLTFVAHSQAAKGDDLEEDSDDEQKLNRLETLGSQSNFRLNEYYNESKSSALEKPVNLPDYYKGSQIVTSTTLNSGTTDSRSEREALMTDQQGPNPYAKTSMNNSAMVPLSEEPNDEMHQTRPYSVIRDSDASLGRSGASSKTGAIPAYNAPQQFYRDISNSSSFYTESPKGVSRTGSLNTTDLKPNSVLGLDDTRKKNQPTGHDELQGIIKNAIDEEDDDEFIKQQTVDPSEIPPLDDDDGIKDDDSDFTSVSQRGVNPNYMPSVTANRVQHPQHMPMVANQKPRVGLLPSANHYFPPQQYSGPPVQQGHTPYARAPAFQHHPPQMYQQQPSAGYPQQYQVPPQRSQYGNAPTASDMVLNANPDFMVAGNARKPRGPNMYPQAGATSTHYKPAYKKRLPRQTNLPPASMTREGPYSGMM
ncbi:LAFE_0F10814g1_1 [Lachancea fermentati]|uniref:LAFE_0F10814g1_1 n=1 Tax=Lachancea fermentati TaxID=4955 RepID=A0A1G4MFI2_LACFM|nr:LAFE_0F10814g1_1 [Lachancea fermentati]